MAAVAMNVPVNSSAVPMPIRAAMYEPGKIVLARPLHELWAHVKNRELPSWELVARVVSVLVLRCVTGHFHDRVMLLRPDAFYHSFKGKVEVIKATGTKRILQHFLPSPYFKKEDLKNFDERYPHLLNSALYLKLQSHSPSEGHQPGQHDYHYEHLTTGTDVCVYDLSKYSSISPETLHSYYLTAYGIELTPSDPVTISSLLKSERMCAVHIDKVHNFTSSTRDPNQP